MGRRCNLVKACFAEAAWALLQGYNGLWGSVSVEGWHTGWHGSIKYSDCWGFLWNHPQTKSQRGAWPSALIS